MLYTSSQQDMINNSGFESICSYTNLMQDNLEQAVIPIDDGPTLS